MSEEPLWVGAAAAGDRWVAIAFDAEGFDRAAVHDDAGALWERYGEGGRREATRLLLDVPIGLPERVRECDRRARALLGPRAGAVVDPPARTAARKRRFRAADRAHERATGDSLSEAAFRRSDAVSLVDELLAEVPEARETLAPAHPELCFRAFAGEPLEHDPDAAGGYAERLRTLARVDRDAPPVLQSACEDLGDAPVTVADAMAATVLAYTARPGAGELRSLPADPPVDDRALPVRWVYRSETPL